MVFEELVRFFEKRYQEKKVGEMQKEVNKVISQKIKLIMSKKVFTADYHEPVIGIIKTRGKGVGIDVRQLTC